jgi:toxin-antitoxin system PIN domain toxin
VNTYLLDVNVLLALSLPTHQHHGAATSWFETGVRWATTPMTETAYVRLMSNPRVVGYDIAATAAIDALTTMRGLPAHEFIPDEGSLAEPTIDVSRLSGSKLVTDFHLVNLAATVESLFATFDGRLVRALHVNDQRHVLLLSD